MTREIGKISFETVPEEDVPYVTRGIISRSNDPLAAVIIGSGRIRHCDEAIVARNEESTAIGIAALAPKGESGEEGGVPEVVGVYVAPDYRRNKVGSKLLTRAIGRLRKRGFYRVKLRILTQDGSALVRSLKNNVVTLCEVQSTSSPS